MLDIFHLQQILISIWLYLLLWLIPWNFSWLIWGPSSLVIKSPLFSATSIGTSLHFFCSNRNLALSPVTLFPEIHSSGNWVDFSTPYTSQFLAGLSVFLILHCHTQSTVPSFSLKTCCSLKAHDFWVYHLLTIPTEWLPGITFISSLIWCLCQSFSSFFA